ncbi:hypothetical protein GCM10009582_27990 [Arthrobacter flavus]
MAAPANASNAPTETAQSSSTEVLDSKWEAEFRATLVNLGYDKPTQDEIISDAKIIGASEPAPTLGKQSSTGGVSTLAAANACSYSPESYLFGLVSFTATCQQHDICYGPNSFTDRYACDQAFLAELINDCYSVLGTTGTVSNGCVSQAGVYYGAVRAFGSSSYDGRGANN